MNATIYLNPVERHNSYGHIKPDAAACHRCGRKAFTTPVDGFQVRECGRCQNLVCETCAEIDFTSWQCAKGCEETK